MGARSWACAGRGARAGGGRGRRWSAAPPGPCRRRRRPRGPNPRPERRPATQLLPASAGPAAAAARGPAEGHFLACKWLFVVLPAWGGTGDRRERVCARGSASAFPPAGAEHELPAPFERKRKEEKLGCNSSASGRWARGRGAAEQRRRRLGDGGDPRLQPPPPAPDRPRRARRERRPHRREQSASILARRRRPARGRPPGEVGRRRGKCAGRRVGRGRREHAARGASRARPVPAAGAELRARSRGLPGLPGGSQVREEEKKGSRVGASAGRRGAEGTPPCRAGRANGGGGCIIATLSPRRQLSSPIPESSGGQRRGGVSPGGPRGGPGALCPRRDPPFGA